MVRNISPSLSRHLGLRSEHWKRLGSQDPEQGSTDVEIMDPKGFQCKVSTVSDTVETVPTVEYTEEETVPTLTGEGLFGPAPGLGRYPRS